MEKDVLGFEIPVDDIVIVHELKRVADLADDGLDFSLGQDFLPPQVGIKVARKAQFQHQVNVGLV